MQWSVRQGPLRHISQPVKRDWLHQVRRPPTVPPSDRSMDQRRRTFHAQSTSVHRYWSSHHAAHHSPSIATPSSLTDDLATLQTLIIRTDELAQLSYNLHYLLLCSRDQVYEILPVLGVHKIIYNFQKVLSLIIKGVWMGLMCRYINSFIVVIFKRFGIMHGQMAHGWRKMQDNVKISWCDSLFCGPVLAKQCIF